MDIDRPQQKQQSSRKGKRSWRKNIDLDEIEQGLEERREELIQHGNTVENLESNELFYIDDEADEQITKKLKKNNVKLLKSQEILNQRSKVPALPSSRQMKKSKVDSKTLQRLLKLGNKVDGVTKTQALVESQGIITSKAYDVWNDQDPDEKIENKPEVLVKSSSISHTIATVVPKTLKQKPITVRMSELKPHEGKSYNPSFDSWQGLIQQEFYKEKTKEDKKILLEEHQKKIMHLMETLNDKEVDDSDDDDSDSSEQEEEEEEQQDDDEESNKYQLSINPAVKNKQKTKTQRNKQQRHKERVKLEEELKELKLRLKELEKLPDLLSSEPIQNSKNKLSREESELRKVIKEKKKLGSKHLAIESGLEVKLSDELSDSLRKLKPEGNLLYDQMKHLQDSGKIETRKPIKQKQKYTPKISEKWTYKDFKW